MNIITLWTRFFAGMIFCLFATMMLFVEKKPLQKFSEVVENGKVAIARHRYCLTPGEERAETCWPYTFVHPDDIERADQAGIEFV